MLKYQVCVVSILFGQLGVDQMFVSRHQADTVHQLTQAALMASSQVD